MRNAREYKAAVAEVDPLLDRGPAHGTLEYERLEFLSVLIEAYEEKREPFTDRGTPQEVVEFMLVQHGRTRASLAALLGGWSRVSDFFKGRRRLSIQQIKALRDELGIPADLLIA